MEKKSLNVRQERVRLHACKLINKMESYAPVTPMVMLRCGAQIWLRNQLSRCWLIWARLSQVWLSPRMDDTWQPPERTQGSKFGTSETPTNACTITLPQHQQQPRHSQILVWSRSHSVTKYKFGKIPIIKNRRHHTWNINSKEQINNQEFIEFNLYHIKM